MLGGSETLSFLQLSPLQVLFVAKKPNQSICNCLELTKEGNAWKCLLMFMWDFGA